MATLAVPVSPTDHRDGPAHAPVTVIEYGDFECPICRAVEPSVRQLRELHHEQMVFVFRHFPLEDAHPLALVAAEAAESAAAQGKFWPMHGLLLAEAHPLNRHRLEQFAQRLGLDMARFRADLDDEIYRQRVRDHQEGGRLSHLRATPTFFVNGVVQDVSGGMHDLFDLVSGEIGRALRR
ncbi:MAG: thioredoxin domain-containing protein [Gammaproteobacteria bacterium]|nr:thioredoxin domain-containing protein [Gammaproteobacteria bacterium]MDE2250310.1 thioredoxin domain-containing protein [Gammaproteobacteria bacterium]